MAKFRVAWTIHKYGEAEIDVESFEKAQEWFENSNIDGDLFFIEDENGEQVIYDCV